MTRTAQANARRSSARPQPPAERLSAAGLKPSRNRITVLEELARESNDATAQELHQRLIAGGRPIGLATVYRALGAMSEAGVVDALPHGSETCYRLCGKGHHHHLVCDNCHRVVELPGCPATAWIDRAADEVGFVATDHRLEVRGLCASCR
jgi:Fur family transcriptional regulator, ferric uptake regulator